MKVPAKAIKGQRCKVLIGRTWHPCTVVDVWWWDHHSGDSFPAYRIQFDDGAVIQCGNNSLKPIQEKAKAQP